MIWEILRFSQAGFKPPEVRLRSGGFRNFVLGFRVLGFRFGDGSNTPDWTFQVVASDEEIRLTFSRTDKEAGLRVVLFVFGFEPFELNARFGEHKLI